MTEHEIEQLIKEYIQIEINYRMDCEIAYPSVAIPDETVAKRKYQTELIAARVHAQVKREEKLADLAHKMYHAIRFLQRDSDDTEFERK